MLSSVRNAPFDRLGGLDTLERAVAELFGRLKTTPELMPLLPEGIDAGNTAETEWQVELWLTDILGGPMKYDGPAVAGLFGHQHATREKWTHQLGGLIADALLNVGAMPAAVDEAREVIDAALAALPFGSTPGAATPAPAPAPARSEFAIAWRDEPGFPIAWRDEPEAHKRSAIIAQLKAQAEDLPVPVMFPDASGELWFGNAACEHAMTRLAAWLPDDFDPMQGIPVALFFPDADERRAIFSDPDALPLKKRVCLGPETVSLRITAIRDDEQRFLCPQITWEIFHTMAALDIANESVTASVSHAVPSMRAPVGIPSAAPATTTPGLAETASGLRREARAIEESARALLGLTELLDTLADRATGHGASAPVESIAAAVADASGAEQMVEQGLAALDAARSVVDGPGRSREVTAALSQLMELARRTNQLVLDASQRAVEEEVAGAATGLITRVGALRSVLATQVSGLAEEAQGVSRQLEQGATKAGRFAELREAMRGPAA